MLLEYLYLFKEYKFYKHYVLIIKMEVEIEVEEKS